MAASISASKDVSEISGVHTNGTDTNGVVTKISSYTNGEQELIDSMEDLLSGCVITDDNELIKKDNDSLDETSLPEDVFKKATGLMNKDDFVGALECYQRLSDWDTSDVTCFLQKGRMELILGMIKEAKKSFTRAKTETPDDSTIDAELSTVVATEKLIQDSTEAFKNNQCAKALTCVTDALLQAHACKDLLMEKIDLLLYCDKYREAKTLIDSYPNDSLFYMYGSLRFLHFIQHANSELRKTKFIKELKTAGFSSHPRVEKLILQMNLFKAKTVEIAAAKKANNSEEYLKLNNLLIYENNLNTGVQISVSVQLAMHSSSAGNLETAVDHLNNAIRKFEPLRGILPDTYLSICYCMRHDYYAYMNMVDDARFSLLKAIYVDQDFVSDHMAKRPIPHDKCPCSYSVPII